MARYHLTRSSCVLAFRLAVKIACPNKSRHAIRLRAQSELPQSVRRVGGGGEGGGACSVSSMLNVRVPVVIAGGNFLHRECFRLRGQHSLCALGSAFSYSFPMFRQTQQFSRRRPINASI